MSQSTPQVRQFDDLDALAHDAAEQFARLAREASEARGRFAVALSGGSTPRHFHGLLVASPFRQQIAWEQVQFWWGDERFVPYDDPQSNYRMARETLLDHLDISRDQVHPVPTPLGDPPAAAVAYEHEMRQAFGLAQDEQPRFDLILLGMGPDGHTASLFPHTGALAATARIVVANGVPQLQTTRITLTADAINAAANVSFLVAGDDKAHALKQVLEGPHDPETYPSQLIAPVDGTLTWFVDHAAAAQLAR